MYSARCPVCDDLISPGVAVKQNQVIICPTCLANLQVVSVSPLEFEEAHRTDGSKHYAGSRGFKKGKNGGKGTQPSASIWGLEEPGDDDYADFDDYTIEHRLRHKTGRPKPAKGQI